VQQHQRTLEALAGEARDFQDALKVYWRDNDLLWVGPRETPPANLLRRIGWAIYALRKYFIAGDVHFTELGHRLLFDEVKRVESLPAPGVQSSRNPRPGSTP